MVITHTHTHTHTHTQVMEQMKAMGHDTMALWADIEKLCLRTLAIKHPHLWQTYHSVALNEEVLCFGLSNATYQLILFLFLSFFLFFVSVALNEEVFFLAYKIATYRCLCVCFCSSVANLSLGCAQ